MNVTGERSRVNMMALKLFLCRPEGYAENALARLLKTLVQLASLTGHGRCSNRETNLLSPLALASLPAIAHA